jgi:hypothetical protein
MRMPDRVVLVMLACGIAGCDASRPPVPTGPTPLPQPQSTAILVNGYVSDSAFRPLAGAVVEVLDGPQAGLSATVTADGRFTLSGNFDDSTRFRASREGNVASSGTLSPKCATCSGARFIYFVLGVLAPPVEIAGDYTLTFVADSKCAGIPSELRTRTYNATITPRSDSHNPANTSFLAAVSGAQFLKGYESFPVGVAGDLVAFDLRGEGPWVVEESSPNTYLGFDGRAEFSVGTARGSTMSAPFQGWIDYCALKSPMGRYYECRAGLADAHAECESTNHQLILSRR